MKSINIEKETTKASVASSYSKVKIGGVKICDDKNFKDSNYYFKSLRIKNGLLLER